ncbi:MAG: ferrous iron transport protein A, partial [Armatimonadota bacterium]|nr:ferrous iron transport protein A [Armatimonadota bacterium]
AKTGYELQIIAVPDDIRSQLVRLGISEGSRVVCLEKIPFGPIILRSRRQEIAIGRELAKQIEVRQ